jgi:glutamyl-tRNA reductase
MISRETAAVPEILLIGLNHETAPVELRECIALSEADSEEGLRRLGRAPGIREAMLLSTCNRVEVLTVTEDPAAAAGHAKTFLSKIGGMDPAVLEGVLYTRKGDAAVRHVFRVAASLDSMMVGEPQILGQMKEAYRMATVKKTTGVILNRLLHRAFFVAKRVRTETGIGDHAVSISYAAIELAKKIFETLEGKKVLLIGAGEMAEIAVEHLVRNRSGTIFVANRTFQRGMALAQKFKGQAVRFEEIERFLPVVDIIISSTGSPEVVIQREQVRGVTRMRKNRPFFFIDIAVPRDIDPEINQLPNSYVYDIDDLKGITKENIKDRLREAAKGERIVEEAVLAFRRWYESLEVVPTVVALRNKIETIVNAEIEKTLAGLDETTDAHRHALRRMAAAMVNKILHDPTLYLKDLARYEAKAITLDITRKLFKLDD